MRRSPTLIRAGFTLIVLTCVLNLSGCALFLPEPAEAIVGAWKTEVNGFPVTVVYSKSAVQIGSSAPVTYSLTGDELRIVGGGSEVRRLSFNGRDEMVQLDPLTGTQQRYVRMRTD